MQTITVPYVLDQLTHSTVWVGVGAFCTFFPATVVGPVAGSLADRYSRRTVLLCSQVVLMASALALWAVWVSGEATPGADRGLRDRRCDRRGHHHRRVAGLRARSWSRRRR